LGEKSGTMKKTIQAFLDNNNVAVAGASNKRDNFGLSILKELSRMGYQVHPVNPRCEEIEDIPCVPTVKELPSQVENVILAVPSKLTEEIVRQCVGTHIKRVWMIKGMGNGAYSEQAHQVCRENNIEVVYGFCPMMFFGKGFHKFHFWMRRNLGRVPVEFNLN
jgi:predicted CoA-binding protein